MSKRRGNREGSIIKTKDGSWRGGVQLGRDDDGKEIRKYAYRKTRGETVDAIKDPRQQACQWQVATVVEADGGPIPD